MSNEIVDFWCSTYLELHGFQYPHSKIPRLAKILQRIQQDHNDPDALMWAIRAFPTRLSENKYCLERGFDAVCFENSYLGLHREYIQYREGKLAHKKRNEMRQLEATAEYLDGSAKRLADPNPGVPIRLLPSGTETGTGDDE